jgi:xanthine dehydrogenase accessory factor
MRRLCAPHDTGRVDLFVESYAPTPRMLVLGANNVAGALARVGRLLGYRVTICDASQVFTSPGRFPDADEVVVEWPHRCTGSVSSVFV